MHSDDRIPESQPVLPGEKVDDLQRSGLRIIQDPARFCFGMDAVLLTGFIQEGIGGRSMAGEKPQELGTGDGNNHQLHFALTTAINSSTV